MGIKIPIFNWDKWVDGKYAIYPVAQGIFDPITLDSFIIRLMKAYNLCESLSFHTRGNKNDLFFTWGGAR